MLIIDKIGPRRQAFPPSSGLSGVKIITDSSVKKNTDIASRIDILLLDLVMPGALDGLRTLATIKTIIPEMPVIILTSVPPEKALLSKLAEIGAQRYLNKTASNLDDLILNNIGTLLTTENLTD